MQFPERFLLCFERNGLRLIPYTADHRRLVKIGVEFSKEAKGIKRWLTKIII